MQKYHHFFLTTNPDIVKTQTVVNGAFTQFNLWKKRKTNVSEIIKELKAFSVLMLTPPSLNYKRQGYLYQNIRLFVRVRDEFKDIKPIIYADDE